MFTCIPHLPTREWKNKEHFLCNLSSWKSSCYDNCTRHLSPMFVLSKDIECKKRRRKKVFFILSRKKTNKHFSFLHAYVIVVVLVKKFLFFFCASFCSVLVYIIGNIWFNIYHVILFMYKRFLPLSHILSSLHIIVLKEKNSFVLMINYLWLKVSE